MTDYRRPIPVNLSTTRPDDTDADLFAGGCTPCRGCGGCQVGRDRAQEASERPQEARTATARLTVGPETVTGHESAVQHEKELRGLPGCGSKRRRAQVKKIIATTAAAAAMLALVGCSSDADVASQNLSKDADNFKIVRRVVFVNGITDKYLLSIEGRCSIHEDNRQLEVTCKTSKGFKKHFLGLSDNVTYFVEQMQDANASTDHYKIIFKPSAVIPDVEAR